MDTLSSYARKSEALKTESLRPIVKKLQKVIHSRLVEASDPRVIAPALLRSATFDLSYILIRHRQWHHAELLSELAIDYLTSDYLIPGTIATQIVESALDVLHSYTPREIEWTALDYEHEFLEHLIVCSLISRDEEALAIDLGFGRNVLGLLKNALELESGHGMFHFASDLSQKLSDNMQRIFDEIEKKPEHMDLYRLKNLLQRDDSTAKNKLKMGYLQILNTILTACWPDGKTEAELQGEVEDDHFATDLRVLLRNGLLYEEPRSRGQKSLYRLSNKGYELTSTNFAFSHWQEVGSQLHLQHMPSAYQSTVLQILAKESVENLQDLLEAEGQYLSPQALRFVVEHLKQSGDEQGLVEIFANLLHNQAHAWIRVVICQALPLPSGKTLSPDALDNLLNHDPSPMVRSAARASVQRSRRRANAAQGIEARQP